MNLYLWACKTRRSIFGYFTRRCYVSFLKLSFAGLVKLCQDYQEWCDGDNSAGYAVFQKDQLNSKLLYFDILFYDHNHVRRSPDSQDTSRQETLGQTRRISTVSLLITSRSKNGLIQSLRWERGQLLGDENIASENLRRFFEQHFHENNDS